MRLYHVSEDPDILVFHPRLPKRDDLDPATGLVWALAGTLVLRKLWRPAGIYAGVVLALVLLWALGLHARVPVAMEAAGCLFTLGLLCVVPGFLANGWYYQQVRSQTLSTLTAASSIAQARAKLGHGAPSKARLYRVAAVQALCSMALAALVYSQWDHASRGAHSTPAPSGPPDLVIPQVSSLYSPAPSAPGGCGSRFPAASPRQWAAG